MSHFPRTRLRRLRQTAVLRRFVQETQVHPDHLVHPVFIKEGQNIKHPIASLPGHYQWSLDRIAEEIDTLQILGLRTLLLFGIPSHKDALGQHACDENGIIQQALRFLRQKYPNLLLIADLCFCEYTDHGHCGVLTRSPTVTVDNDRTLPLLSEQALSLAAAGADILAPSGMIDGMIGQLRDTLDQAGFTQLPLMSYSAKYASQYYGAFRAAADCAPQAGDRHGYQMNPANGNEALREVALDIAEGADIVMVKPAQSYLDVIYRLKQAYPSIPLAAYHVSGEYAAICAAAERGWLDRTATLLEVITGIKRAGADIIITYFTKELAAILREL